MKCAFCPKQQVFFFSRDLILAYERLGRGSKSYDLRVEESCSLWGHVEVAVSPFVFIEFRPKPGDFGAQLEDGFSAQC